MSATKVSIRLGIEGKADVTRALAEVGQSGSQAMAQVERALDKTGAATERETARFRKLAEAARLASEAEAAQARFNAVLGVGREPAPSARVSAEVIEGALSQRDAKNAIRDAANADAAQGRFNQVLGVDRGAAKSARDSADAFERAAREAEDMEARAWALRAQLDPLAAAQERLNRELAEYDQLAKAGAISATEQAAAQALARERFEATSRAMQAGAASSGMMRQRIMALNYTVSDAVASLASGVSPLTILLQQGPQVADAWGGIGPLFRSIGAAMTGVTGIVAGLATVVVAGGLAWLSYDASTRAVATALQGVGRSSGATRADLEAAAQASAAAGKVSVSAAREMSVAYLATSKVGSEEIGRATALARDFGVTMGVETAEGASQLAKALADPVRGFDELNERLGLLDDRTREHVRTLVEQGKRTDAQRILLERLKPALADAEQATNAFGRAWGFVARNASDAWDAIGKAVDRAADGRSPADELNLLNWQRDQLRANMGDSGSAPLMLAPIEARIAQLERQLGVERLKAELAAAEARASARSITAGETARDVVPGAQELERLKSQQAALRLALDDPQTRSKLADLAQTEDAYGRVTAAIEAYRPSVDATTRSLNLLASTSSVVVRATIAAAEAFLEGGSAAAHAEAARQGLIDQAREGVDTEARAAQAMRERTAETALDGARQVDQLRGQVEAQKRVNGAVASGAISSARVQQAMQIEQALRPLIIAQTNAEGEAKATLTRVIDETVAAYGRLFDEQSRGTTIAANIDRAQEIALLQRQIALVNESAAARGAGLAVLRAEQELRQRGVDLASAEAQAYLATAVQIEQLNRVLAGRQALVDQGREIAVLEAQLRLIGATVTARSEELAILRARNALDQRGVDPDSGEGQAGVANAARIDQLTRALAAQEALRDQQDELRLTEAQIKLLQRGTAEREILMAGLRTEFDLRRRNIDLESQEGQLLVERSMQLERLTQELQRQEGAQRALETVVGSSLDRFADVLAQGTLDWKSWADAGRAALMDINREMIRLAVLNPLKNLLFGQNNPTFGDAGGLLGGLFKNPGSLFSRTMHLGGIAGIDGPMRAMPAAVFAGAPRFHDGVYLKPDEVPAILQRGERVLNRSETRAYQRDRKGSGMATVNVTIQTPNPSAFDASRTQIAAGLARAVQSGMRGM